MPRRRKRPPAPPKSTLSINDILTWADEYHARTGHWPVARTSGKVEGQGDLTWMAVDMALSKGHRGLPGGTTLAKLLVEHRGHRHHFQLPRLTRALILKWADAHFMRTGSWPTKKIGDVVEAPGETWSGIDAALHTATRGIGKKTTLARLLAKYRGRRHGREKEGLTIERILEWARAWRVLYGRWPSHGSGPIGTTGETWLRVNAALIRGLRGLAGGTTSRRSGVAAPSGGVRPLPRSCECSSCHPAGRGAGAP
jgi:hypothetical protein